LENGARVKRNKRNEPRRRADGIRLARVAVHEYFNFSPLQVSKTLFDSYCGKRHFCQGTKRNFCISIDKERSNG